MTARKEKKSKAEKLKEHFRMNHKEKEFANTMQKKWNGLPENERKKQAEEEDKLRRLEIKEAMENIWRRWRREARQEDGDREGKKRNDGIKVHNCINN